MRISREESEVSIIIVNYYSWELIANAVDSIRRCCRREDYEIIVVDNTPDADGEKSHGEAFWDRWLVLGENVGFARACNAGARLAKGRYLLFLNPDTLVLNDVISKFRDYVESTPASDSHLGVVGAYLLNEEGVPIRYKGSFNRCLTPLTDLLEGLVRRLWRHKLVGREAPERVEWAYGAVLFLSKRLFEEVGGFDEDFFMYCEDMDLQKRIHDIGRENVVIPGPRIIHLEGGGSYRRNRGMTYRQFEMWQRSRKIYYTKHFNLAEIIVWKVMNIIFSMPVIIKQHWNFKTKIRAYYRAVKS